MSGFITNIKNLATKHNISLSREFHNKTTIEVMLISRLTQYSNPSPSAHKK